MFIIAHPKSMAEFETLEAARTEAETRLLAVGKAVPFVVYEIRPVLVVEPLKPAVPEGKFA